MIVIILVTSRTCIRCVVVISVVAGHALIGNDGMRAIKHVILIVDGE